MTIDIDAVTKILREAAQESILPRFRSLGRDEVTEKAPGEIVTVADRESEATITRRLRELLDVPVVGEEATSTEPKLLRALADEPAVWLVDPLDGTRNFVRGSEDFAVMAALVREGEAVASAGHAREQGGLGQGRRAAPGAGWRRAGACGGAWARTGEPGRSRARMCTRTAAASGGAGADVQPVGTREAGRSGGVRPGRDPAAVSA